MEHRGPILLLFAALLVLSPLAIRGVQIAAQGGSAPATVGIATMGADRAACDASTFRTDTYTIGCAASRQHRDNRSQGAGGSLIINVN